MTQQFDLGGTPAISPPDMKITWRQQLALENIRAHQPVSSDELGALLHEDRMKRGGRGHPADERCEWCSSEGAQMGAALRRHGLVVGKRGLGWCLVGYRPLPAGTSSQNASGDGLDSRGLPEGF